MKSKSTLIFILGLVFLIIVFPTTSFSQTIEGDWYGKANIQGIELRISIHVKTSDQGLTSTWDSPDQGASGIPSTTTTFKFPDFSFTHAGAGFKYTGQVNASYTEISGSLEQGGQKLPIVFGRTPVPPAANLS